MFGYEFSETGTGGELNPRLPHKLRKAYRELLANDGKGSYNVVSKFLQHLNDGAIQVTEIAVRPFHLSAAPYSAVQSPSFDVLPSLTCSSCTAFRTMEELPTQLAANLQDSLTGKYQNAGHPSVRLNSGMSQEIRLPLLG